MQSGQKAANNETPTNMVPTYGKHMNEVGDLKNSANQQQHILVRLLEPCQSVACQTRDNFHLVEHLTYTTERRKRNRVWLNCSYYTRVSNS
ncbi:MAG: hypothetical protein ACI9RO_001661 [Alteromonas macleodii]|jgi:hypothetical protein